VGPFPAQLPPARLAPPSPRDPSPSRAPRRSPLTGRPHPSARTPLSLSLSRSLSLPGKRVPLVSAFLAPVTGLATRSLPVATTPSSCHYSLAYPVGALRQPSHPVSPLPEPSRRHHCAPPSSLVDATSRPLPRPGRL
jgi:hypothetical protein